MRWSGHLTEAGIKLIDKACPLLEDIYIDSHYRLVGVVN